MSYRNDVEALQIRLTQLEQELSGIREERARLVSAARSEPRLITELDALRRELTPAPPGSCRCSTTSGWPRPATSAGTR